MSVPKRAIINIFMFNEHLVQSYRSPCCCVPYTFIFITDITNSNEHIYQSLTYFSACELSSPVVLSVLIDINIVNKSTYFD